MLDKIRQPDLIIADLNIPGLAGIELIKLVKSSVKDKIPILVISGMDDEKLKSQLFEIGICDFLIKPIGRETLKLRVADILKE